MASDKTNPLSLVISILYVVMGAFLVLAFFLPLYGNAFLDIGGLDLLRAATRDPKALSRLTQDSATFFMVITPFLFWLLGIISLVIGALRLATQWNRFGIAITILAGFMVIISVVTIFSINNQSTVPGLFAKMFPKPGTTFYLTILAEVGLLVAGILSVVQQQRAS
ncbi:MAG: hypothetical protein AAGN35_07775 [Bacteroidota bacterium]